MNKVIRGMNLIGAVISHDLKRYLKSNEGHSFSNTGMTLCPFHDDHLPSMSISQENGSWVWYCHACKKGGNIIHYMMEKYDLDKAEAIRKLASQFNLKLPAKKPKVIAEYSYTDEQGNELYKILRFEPKSFKADRKMNGVRQVPYLLPEVLKAETLWLIEGEKDVNNVRKLGLIATTVPFGVSNWKKEFSNYLKDKEVLICLDKGCEREAERRAKDLLEVARKVKVITLPGLEKKGDDISDWIEIHDAQDREALKNMLNKIALEASIFDISSNELRINHGFLRLYCEAISRSTDAPYIFALFSGIALLSTILSKFYFYYPLRTHLNLYILLLAPSTFYRKTVTLDIAGEYLREVNNSLCLPESFTPEALFSILQEQPRGIIFWREFNQVREFQLAKEYSKGLSELLTDIYDFKKVWKRKIKSEKTIILKEPILSILVAGITSWFTDKLKEIDFQGGLWTRFLFVPAPEHERSYNWPEKLELDPEIIKRLKKLDSLDVEGLGPIDYSKVKSLIIEWGNQHINQAQKLESEIFRASFLRLEVMLLKIAALLQLSQDCTPIVKPENFHMAVKIIEYLKKNLSTFFKEEIVFGEDEKNKARVLKYLKKHKTVLYRNLLQNVRMNAKALKAALYQLEAEGSIFWKDGKVEYTG